MFWVNSVPFFCIQWLLADTKNSIKIKKYFIDLKGKVN